MSLKKYLIESIVLIITFLMVGGCTTPKQEVIKPKTDINKIKSNIKDASTDLEKDLYKFREDKK